MGIPNSRSGLTAWPLFRFPPFFYFLIIFPSHSGAIISHVKVDRASPLQPSHPFPLQKGEGDSSFFFPFLIYFPLLRKASRASSPRCRGAFPFAGGQSPPRFRPVLCLSALALPGRRESRIPVEIQKGRSPFGNRPPDKSRITSRSQQPWPARRAQRPRRWCSRSSGRHHPARGCDGRRPCRRSAY